MMRKRRDNLTLNTGRCFSPAALRREYSSGRIIKCDARTHRTCAQDCAHCFRCRTDTVLLTGTGITLSISVAGMELLLSRDFR